jgi:CubicO group peptidase (beta-lactamase class C family)
MWHHDTYWAHFVLSRDLVHPPGTFFAYSDGFANLTGQVIRYVTGTLADLWADTVLFEPLGIDNYEWEGDWRSLPNTGYGLYLRPRDMAKFGQLYLDRGVWNGQRIISEDWVDTSTTTKIVVHPGTYQVGYGFYWWTVIVDVEGQLVSAYLASGDYGQQIFVVDAYNLVAVFTMGMPEGEGYTEARRALTEYILPAAQ